MPKTQETLDQMAGEIFELYRYIALARSRQPTGPEDLSETEFLALDMLMKQDLQTIGEIQKSIGIVPAQMSRIVRSLETQGGKGYVECKINPSDRRRIDLAITKAGKEAYNKFRDNRLRSMYQVLNVIPPDDRLEFMRILRQLREAFAGMIDES